MTSFTAATVEKEPKLFFLAFGRPLERPTRPCSGFYPYTWWAQLAHSEK